MKYLFKYLYFCIVFLLPLTTHAEIRGEVIFRHPDNPNELWITDVENIGNARLLFTQKDPIHKLSVQKNGTFIVTITKNDDPTFPFDVYLVDRSKVPAQENNLTHKLFTEILDVKVSIYGDIFFSNNQIRTDMTKGPPPASGIYYIPNYDLENFFQPKQRTIFVPGPAPDIVVKAQNHWLLKGVETSRIALSSNRYQIAYETEEGVFLFNLNTGEVVQISRGGSFPTFSPDGEKIAFVFRHFGAANSIEVLSADTLHFVNSIRTPVIPQKLFDFFQELLDLKWSPDGKYLIYTTCDGDFMDPNSTYHNYAVSLDGKERFQILEGIFDNGVPMFDWVTSEVPYTVEPKNRLTTLWGKLKQ